MTDNEMTPERKRARQLVATWYAGTPTFLPPDERAVLVDLVTDALCGASRQARSETIGDIYALLEDKL